MKRFNLPFTDKYYVLVGEDNSYIFSVAKNRILIPWKHNKGYLKLTLIINGHRYAYYMHRLVMCAVYGMDIHTMLTVDHIDEDKHNNHPRNLRELSRVDNTLKRWGKYNEKNHFGSRYVYQRYSI